MARLQLSKTNGFTLIPEGTYVFKVVKVDYDEDFGKMDIELQTKGGLVHHERFKLINKDGEMNEGALNAYSYFAKTALNNFELEEIDTDDIVGCYIQATVSHEEFESNKNPGRMLKSVRLNDYAIATGFTDDEDPDDDTDDEGEDDDLDDFLD